MNYAVALADDVREILERSTITDAALTLPRQLDRRQYERVNKVIEAAGGTWDRKLRVHVFPRNNARAALGLAFDQGHVIDIKRAAQQFFTPPDLAQDVVGRLNITPGMLFLEPSAGGGALALVARRAGAKVVCVEIDPELQQGLVAQGFEVVPEPDFLQVLVAPVFDVIAMNPPFTKGQAVAHVEHAFSFLKPGGCLVAIMDAGVRFRSDRATKAFRARLTAHGGTIEDLPPGSFKASGTNVNTVLVTWSKPLA